MYFKTAFTALLLILCINLNSQVKTIYYNLSPVYSSITKTYEGVVTKITDGNPIPGVELSIDNLGILGFTDNTGYFKIEAPENIAAINFKKEGFIGAREVILGNSKFEIAMFPENPTKSEEQIIQKSYALTSFNDLSGESLKAYESKLKSMLKTEVPAVIRVLMPDNTVVVMSTDEYLKGVVPAEVPPSWDMDALKAQSVAARSYASVNFKHNSQGADVCTSTHCQAWKSTQHSRTTQAVNETSNFSVKYQGNIINALFFSHCNGTTRNNESVWAGTPVPYLRSVSCPCGFTAHNAHGVGMCQYGTQAMALKDSTWESILKWYYTGTTVDKTPLVYGKLKGAIYFGSDNTNLNNRITGATVKLHNGLEVTSANEGLYSFDLVPGQYTVTASKPGYRSATVTREVTAGNTIWGSIELTPNVSVSELSSGNVMIYPNPVSAKLMIKISEKALVSIFTITGSLVHKELLTSSKSIDVSNFKRGTYIVRVSGANYSISEIITFSPDNCDLK